MHVLLNHLTYNAFVGFPDRPEEKKKKRFCESLRETETEVTVVDENEVEGSDKENE